jgi:hypothetical protein
VRRPTQVIKPIVAPVSVDVRTLHAGRARPDARFEYKPVNV